MNMNQALATLSVTVSLFAFGSVQADGLDPSVYSEDVPEILNQGPAGQPSVTEVRFLEGGPAIDRQGPRGGRAQVVVRDGEGVPEIDRRGLSESELAGFEAGHDQGRSR